MSLRKRVHYGVWFWLIFGDALQSTRCGLCVMRPIISTLVLNKIHSITHNEDFYE